MIIFNIMTIFVKNYAGTEQVYVDYAKSLRGQGHQVINISTFGATINKIFPPEHTLFKYFYPIGQLYVLLLALYYKPNMIICHNNRASYMGLLPKIFQKIPVMGIAHIYRSHYRHLKRYDYISAISKDVANSIVKLGFRKDRVFQISNMIYTTHDYAPKNLFGKKDIILGGLGRLVKEKGFHHLIDTISILRAQGYNAKLILGGTGQELNNLIEQAKSLKLEDHITFMGWVYNKQDFFDKIDIFCLPSDKEPFGLVILEAMNYSKPVIAVAEGGPKDIIQNKVNGLLVQQSAKNFAQATIDIISTENLAENLTKNAYNCLETKYSPSVIGQNLSNIILSIAKK
jgi:glycosyltransferase involved in cell wall biosynthesis